MHIKEVIRITKLSRKTIKYYEEQGLIKPKKPKDNGVKTYTLKEVQTLNSIKFLRSLGVSIDEIKEIILNDKSLDNLLEKKIEEITLKEENLKNLKKLCKRIKSNETDFDNFNVNKYKKEIETLKTNGVDLLAANREKKKRMSIILLRLLMILFFIAIVILLITVYKKETIDIPILIVLIAFALIFILGISQNVKDDIKEIENSEIKKVI